MGTNFYFELEGQQVHLGKRSAAGLYCWDCDVTLCAEGVEGVHSSPAHWHRACPRCGATPALMPVNVVDLFAQAARPSGCSTTASFTWAVQPQMFTALFRTLPALPCVRDEYGVAYTPAAFLEMLQTFCALTFVQLGQEWS